MLSVQNIKLDKFIDRNTYMTKVLPDKILNFIGMRLVVSYCQRKEVKNVGWLFADKVLRMGLGVAIGAWVARYLGPVNFGIYNYALAFVGLFSAIATLGLDGIVVRDIVRDSIEKKILLGSVFVLKAVGGILVLVTATIVCRFIRPGDELMYWLVAIAATGMVFQAFDVIDLWFQSQVKSKYSVIAKNTAFIIIAIVKVILIICKAPLIYFAYAGLIEIMLGSLALVLLYQLDGETIKEWKSNYTLSKRLLNDSWPLILSGFAIMIYMKIDQIMIGEISGNQMLGLYSAATKISEIWYFIPIAIVSSYAPSFVDYKKQSEEEYMNKLFKLFQTVTVISICIALPMTLLSGHVIKILYGSDYASAELILAVHVWTSIFVSLGVAQTPWTLNEGLMKLALQRTVLGAMVNICLNIVLIPIYGGVGAAIATLVSQALSSCFLNLIDKRTRNIFYLQVQAFDVTRYFARS